jgi:hypothetical protein
LAGIVKLYNVCADACKEYFVFWKKKSWLFEQDKPQVVARAGERNQAQDSDQWRAIVDTVMNLRAS